MDTQSRQIIDRAWQCIDQVNKSTSQLYKIDVLKSYPDLRKLFQYTYDTVITFGVTSDIFLREMPSSMIIVRNLFDLLDRLKDRTLTGNEAASVIQDFCETDKDKELLGRIFDRNLKIRANARIINKALPGTVEIFGVALAEKYRDKNIAKVDLTSGQWRASRKLDGCVAGDTLVETSLGPLPIKDIVEKNLDVAVLSYNHATQQNELCQIENRMKRTEPTKEHHHWKRLTFEDGTVIEITENDALFLPELQAYRQVENLQVGDIVQGN